MKILMIEDNIKLCDATAAELRLEGYTVETCHDGDDAAFYLREGAWDVVLLDRMLPGTDGATLLRKARGEGFAAPVLMLTALGEVEDRVNGLDAGADDYLPKPFDTRELMARIRALARRPAELGTSEEYRFGDLLLDGASLVLMGAKSRCTLSKKEAEFLAQLIRAGGQTLTRNQLMSGIWGLDAEVEESNLAIYALYIRRRLASVSGNVELVTVRGVGYRLEELP